MDQTNRYHRQMLLAQIGEAGQRRLASASVLLVGCGALGCTIAEQLVRAGVGRLVLADRDLVELTNLQRQSLFDERDAAGAVPKAVAAASRLTAINSSAMIEPHVVDVDAWNVEALAGVGSASLVDLILDGTDNVGARYLINDVAVKHRIPWIYGACVGTEGRVMAVQPPSSACLRCLFPQPPRADELATCDTAGVLGSAAAVVASLQVTAAIKLLTRNAAAIAEELVTIDLWTNRYRAMSTVEARDPACPCCGERKFESLHARVGDSAVSLCGRNAIQVRRHAGTPTDLAAAEGRLAAVGRVQRTPYLLRCELTEPAGIRLTLFRDGRLIVHGTQDAGRAKSLYARFVGA